MRWQLVSQKDEENKKLKAQIAANDRDAAQISAQLDAWQKKKAAKEADLYDIVSHFTTANPITVEQPAQAAAEAQARRRGEGEGDGFVEDAGPVAVFILRAY